MPRPEENLRTSWGHLRVVHTMPSTGAPNCGRVDKDPQPRVEGEPTNGTHLDGLPTIHRPYYYHYHFDIKQVAV